MLIMLGRRVSVIGCVVVIGLIVGVVVFVGFVVFFLMSVIVVLLFGLFDIGDLLLFVDYMVLDGLDDLVLVLDELIVEMLFVVLLFIVLNVNMVWMVWVGMLDQWFVDVVFFMLQVVLNVVFVGGIVLFDFDVYVFMGVLIVFWLIMFVFVLVVMFYVWFIVFGGGFILGVGVGIVVVNIGVIVSVIVFGVVLIGFVIWNFIFVFCLMGVQLGVGVMGVQIVLFDMDGVGELLFYGINFIIGLVMVVDLWIVGVVMGVIVIVVFMVVDVFVFGGMILVVMFGILFGVMQVLFVSGVEVMGVIGVGIGIDFVQSIGVVVVFVIVYGFVCGIGIVMMNIGMGLVIIDVVIDGSFCEGIVFGVIFVFWVECVIIVGIDMVQLIGILVLFLNVVMIMEFWISGMMYGIIMSVFNMGIGFVIVVLQIMVFGGIIFGFMQGVFVIDVVIQFGVVVGGMGVNFVNFGCVIVIDLIVIGFLYVVGLQLMVDFVFDCVDIMIFDVIVMGVFVVFYGIYLFGVSVVMIMGVEVDIMGVVFVIYQLQGVVVQNVVVIGYEGLMLMMGFVIFCVYGLQCVDVLDFLIVGGFYGFFYLVMQGFWIMNVIVVDFVEYGVYGCSVSELDVFGVMFWGNFVVGLFVVMELVNGFSYDIVLYDNIMVDNDDGILLFQGMSDVDVVCNVISGQCIVLIVGFVYGVMFVDNIVDQVVVEGMVVFMIVLCWQDVEVLGLYFFFVICVIDNIFCGMGIWISVGIVDVIDFEVDCCMLQDVVLVMGNVFLVVFIVIVIYLNVVIGDDIVVQNVVFLFIVGVDGLIVVDVCDYDDLNDWGLWCWVIGFFDGELYYDGGGVEVWELFDVLVLYLMNCVDLFFIEVFVVIDFVVVGDIVIWMLMLYNDGL